MKNVKSISGFVSPNQISRMPQPFFNKGGQHGFFSNVNASEKSFFGSKTIQPKLSIGQPNDRYEKEADAMADKVVQRLASPETLSKKETAVQTKPLANTNTPLVQTRCAVCEQEEKLQKKEEEDVVQESPLELQRIPIFEGNTESPDDDSNTVHSKCAECEKEEKLQTKSDSSGEPTASPDIKSSLNSSKGGGSPLPVAAKEQMESSFGAYFSGVRLHSDSSAVQMNKDLNAQAFTHGSDIYFNSGKYDTGSTGGKHLLAHELTHVVQQRTDGNLIQRQERTPLALSREEIEVEIERLNSEIYIESVGSSRWSELVERRNTLLDELLQRYSQPDLERSFALRVAYNEYIKGVVENPPCTNRGQVVDIYTGVTGPLPAISSSRVVSGTCGRPWCAFFIKWCLNQAGISNSLSGAARSIKTWGEENGWYHRLSGARSVVPVPGDIFYKTPTEEDSSHSCDINPCVSRGRGTGHVGFILSVSGSTVTTIEGNIHISDENDGVYSKTRNISELDGILRVP